MLLIAHRGNRCGRSETENEPVFVMDAMGEGFDVEVDVWRCANRWYLGHDEPTYEVGPGFLTDRRVWCHAKHPLAALELMQLGAHCFIHNIDWAALTSRGFLWTASTDEVTVRTVVVSDCFVEGAYGICSDHVRRLRAECT